MKAKSKNRKLKENWQLRKMFALGKPLAAAAGMEPKDYLEQLAAYLTGRELRLSELYFDEATEILTELNRRTKQANRGPVPLRTEQHRRLKAGIKQIETQEHLQKIDRLRHELGLSKEYVAGISKRVNRGREVPATTEQGNRVIEALKSKVKAARRATA